MGKVKNDKVLIIRNKDGQQFRKGEEIVFSGPKSRIPKGWSFLKYIQISDKWEK